MQIPQRGPDFPAGFEEVPRGCCTVYRYGGELYVEEEDLPEHQILAGPATRTGGGPPQKWEFWEYPQWPRCLVFITPTEHREQTDQVDSIVTRPAEKKEGKAGSKDAAESQEADKQPAAKNAEEEIAESAVPAHKPMSADRIHAALEQGINTKRVPHKSNRVWTVGN